MFDVRFFDTKIPFYHVSDCYTNGHKFGRVEQRLIKQLVVEDKR